MDIDSLVDQEIQDHTARISSAEQVYSDFSSLISSISSIKEKVDQSKTQALHDNYLLAYKLLVDSLVDLLNINSELLSKLLNIKSDYSTYVKDPQD